MNTSTILFIIAGLCLLGSVVCMIIMNQTHDILVPGGLALICVLGFVLTCYLGTVMYSQEKAEILIQEKRVEEENNLLYTERCIEAGYICYIDGILTDGSKVSLSQYYIEINENLKEIYLTKK